MQRKVTIDICELIIVACVCIALALFASMARAQSPFPQDLTLAWNLPTLYEDGSDIQPGDIANIRVNCARHSGETVLDELVPVPSALLPGDRQEQTFVGVIPSSGTYTCYGYALTVEGISSDASNPAQKRIRGKPRPIVFE